MKAKSQHENETAIEFLRRIVNNCDHEPENLLGDLPCIEAVVDFFDLWHAYDTDFWQGVLESIAEGDDPAAARAFVSKWNLPLEWTGDISDAVELAKQPA